MRYFLLQWRFDLIIEEIHYHVVIVYRIYESLFIYDTSFKPQLRLKERFHKWSLIAENDLIQFIEKFFVSLRAASFVIFS